MKKQLIIITSIILLVILGLSGCVNNPFHITNPFTKTPKYTLEDLRAYALQLINDDRANSSLNPVLLGYNAAAQIHADDMLTNRFLSHWGTDGSKPYVRYTIAGGQGSISENAAYSGFFYDEPNAATIDAKTEIAKLEHSMMYDDAPSNWGHRDNILNKWHNRVNIGIAYDNTHLAYVQDFEDDYIVWKTPITYNRNILRLEGNNILGAIQSVALYYDPSLQPLTQSELLDSVHSGSYGLGQEVGYIIPPSYYLNNVPYVNAYEWSVNNSGSFSIAANIKSLLSEGSGVYTVCIWAKSNGEDLMLTTYSIFI
jgi:uncharacterized protein YkwD